jgi:16S rRNA (guanine527-N7)-methyltransferase
MARFETYLALILRWNARMNLTAIRTPNEILSRHFVESIACAQALPAGIATLLDFGSGAGFPGIPIALCRPEIRVTLAESQNKKAAFLQEVVRGLELSTRVFGGRAENLSELFDCVALRAVERMEQAVVAASDLVRVGGWLAVFTTEADLAMLGNSRDGLQRVQAIPLAGSEERLLVLALKTDRAS